MPKILVVENDPKSVKELSQNLGRFLEIDDGWTVMEVSSGKDALQTLYSKSIQLVISPTNTDDMPHGNLFSEMSRDEALSDIPVIALSKNKEEEQDALGKGAVDFFTTPISDYSAIAAKAQTHAMRSMQTINLKRAAEMVALLKDMDNIQSVMLESLVDFCHQIQASMSVVMTLSPEKSWNLYLSHNVPSNVIPFIEKFKESPPETLKLVARLQKGICIKEAQDDVITSDSMDPVITRLGAKSLLVLPLVSGETVIGALVFFFTTERFFDSNTIDAMTKTIPGIVYALKSAKKIENIRESLIGIWRKGAESLRQLSVFPTENCEGCTEPCATCSFLTHEGFMNIEGVVVFIKKLMDSVIELSSNVDNYNRRLEKQVKRRTCQLIAEIEERKKVEQELKKAGAELEKRVEERTAELVTANEIMELDLIEIKRAEAALRKSEGKYRTLIDTIPHGVREQDTDGTITFVNTAYCDMLGLTENEILGKSIDKFINSHDERESVRKYLQRVLRDESLPSTYAVQSVTQSGSVIYTQVDWDYRRNEEGKVTGFISVITDITERKLAEEAVREANSILEARVTARTHELSQANELLKSQITERERIEEELRKTQEELEDRVEERTVGLIRVNGKMASEIEEKIKAEKALTEAHRETERLLAAISSIFIGVDKDGIITRWNEAASRTFGIESQDIVGQRFEDSGIKWNWDEFNTKFPKHQPDRKEFSLENMQYEKPDGETGFLGLTLSHVAGDTATKNRSAGFILLGSDITERKLYQDQLRLADTVYRNTIEGIIITDAGGTIHSVNPAFTSITGYTADEANGKKAIDILNSDKSPKEFYKNIWISLEENGYWDGEVWNRRKNGEAYPQMLSIVGIKDDDGKNRQFLTVMRDITEIKKAEEELNKQGERLLQSEKLAAIGELASGVAHELNQPLNHINLTCQLLIKMLGADMLQKDSIFDEIMIIVDNVQRAVEVISAMRDFARKETSKMVEIDVCKAIETSIKMFGAQLKTHNITLNVESPATPVMALGSLNKLSQVIVNMITNARDALNTVKDDRRKFIDISVLQENGKTYVRVKDNGGGIPAKGLKDIFTPFYTTKEAGAGTGLGLSISYRIITGFGGSIEVESTKEDEGTTMLITLNSSNGN